MFDFSIVLNYSNGLYINIPMQVQQTTFHFMNYKAYVGKGNNG